MRLLYLYRQGTPTPVLLRSTTAGRWTDRRYFRSDRYLRYGRRQRFPGSWSQAAGYLWRRKTKFMEWFSGQFRFEVFNVLNKT